MPKAKLRVFLADDHAVVREGLKALINAQPGMEVSGEAADGRTACQEIQKLQPDVVVMDVSMPEMSGARRNRANRPMKLNRRIGTVRTHQIRDATRKDP